MEFSLSWLAQYVDLPEITTREGGDEIARRLTAAGLAVELEQRADADLQIRLVDEIADKHDIGVRTRR